MSTNTKWAQAGKAAVAAVPKIGVVGNQVKATRFEGVLESAIPFVFKTGSFGVKVKYQVQGLERAVYENIILTMIDKEGMPSPTKYGESTLKKRYLAAGLTSDEINALKTPKSLKDEEGAQALTRLNGAEVALGLVDREYIRDNGTPGTSKDVKYVSPLGGNGPSAA